MFLDMSIDELVASACTICKYIVRGQLYQQLLTFLEETCERPGSPQRTLNRSTVVAHVDDVPEFPTGFSAPATMPRGT